MFRFSLRSFLIASALLSAIVGWWLGDRWRPRTHRDYEVYPGPGLWARYDVLVYTQWRPFGPQRLLAIVVEPAGDKMRDRSRWKGSWGSVYHDGELMPYPVNEVHVALGNGVQKIPVSPEVAAALEAHVAHKKALVWGLRHLSPAAKQERWEEIEAAQLIHSPIWKSEFEPEIFRLIPDPMPDRVKRKRAIGKLSVPPS